jgi:hypothetical protein
MRSRGLQIAKVPQKHVFERGYSILGMYGVLDTRARVPASYIFVKHLLIRQICAAILIQAINSPREIPREQI